MRPRCHAVRQRCQKSTTRCRRNATLPLMAKDHSDVVTGSSWHKVVAALGVVFGDIGTSPLYAMRECFHASHGVALTTANVMGVLSLIFWSLVVVVSIKYLMFVLRAD